jgi:hypothetical protein
MVDLANRNVVICMFADRVEETVHRESACKHLRLIMEDLDIYNVLGRK